MLPGSAIQQNLGVLTVSVPRRYTWLLVASSFTLQGTLTIKFNLPIKRNKLQGSFTSLFYDCTTQLQLWASDSAVLSDPLTVKLSDLLR